MTKYNLTIYKNISRACTVCLAYILVFLTVLSIYETQISRPYYLFGIPIILLLQFLIQRYIFHPVAYFLLHAAFLIPIWFLPYPNLCYKVLYIILFVFEFGHAWLIWKNGSDQPYNELPWFLFLFVAILYITGRILKQDTFATCVYYIGLILIGLHFIRYFIFGLSHMFSEAEHATTMPTRKIMLTNSVFLGMLLFSFFLLTILIQFLHLDHFLYLAGDTLLKLLRVVFQLILYGIALLRLLFFSDSPKEDAVTEEENLQEAIQQIPEPSVFAQILTFLMEIAFIIFVLYLLYRIVRHIIRSFLTRYTSDSDIVVTLSDKTETVKQDKAKTSFIKELQEHFDTSYAAKIRRFYRIQIKQYRELELHRSDTPKDIASQVRMVYDKDIDVLTKVYEKARYSNEEITVEDAKEGGIL